MMFFRYRNRRIKTVIMRSSCYFTILENPHVVINVNESNIKIFTAVYGPGFFFIHSFNDPVFSRNASRRRGLLNPFPFKLNPTKKKENDDFEMENYHFKNYAILPEMLKQKEKTPGWNNIIVSPPSFLRYWIFKRFCSLFSSAVFLFLFSRGRKSERTGLFFFLSRCGS